MGIPIGGSGGILFGGGSIPLPPPVVPPGVAPLLYLDTIRVFAATYSTDDDATPVQTDDKGTVMAAKVDWGTMREEPLASYQPQGVRRVVVSTPTHPGVYRPDQIVHVIAGPAGPIDPPEVLRTIDAATQISGVDPAYTFASERRTG